MTQHNAKSENYDDSMLKCKKINEVIPSLCKDIKQIQVVDKRFMNDMNLRMAEQSLIKLNLLEDSESKIKYVNDYRGHLVTGLNCLGAFMEHLNALKKLNDDQKIKIAAIAGDIVTIQNTITDIVTH